jgi:hypothetical protein
MHKNDLEKNNGTTVLAWRYVHLLLLHHWKKFNSKENLSKRKRCSLQKSTCYFRVHKNRT